jgi:2-keto-3-deoxy-galactonokinase
MNTKRVNVINNKSAKAPGSKRKKAPSSSSKIETEHNKIVIRERTPKKVPVTGSNMAGSIKLVIADTKGTVPALIIDLAKVAMQVEGKKVNRIAMQPGVGTESISILRLTIDLPMAAVKVPARGGTGGP